LEEILFQCWDDPPTPGKCKLYMYSVIIRGVKEMFPPLQELGLPWECTSERSSTFQRSLGSFSDKAFVRVSRGKES